MVEFQKERIKSFSFATTYSYRHIVRDGLHVKRAQNAMTCFRDEGSDRRSCELLHAHLASGTELRFSLILQ